MTVTAVRQIVAYQVTDTYGATASAFIVVPPQQQLVGPQLIAGIGADPVECRHRASTCRSATTSPSAAAGRPSIAASPRHCGPPRAPPCGPPPTTLTLSAPSTAGGPAALYVPIDDGAGSVVVLTLPVQIEPRLVPPPRLDSTELQVEAGTSAIGRPRRR